MKVILHADDLGISTKVNDAIFELMEQGQIGSASILANGPEFEDAVRRSRHFPQCSFGVHLNLTQFEPLTRGTALQALLADDGCFERQRLPLIFGDRLRQAILEEWSAQVRRAREAGLEVTHLDSHHHVHTALALLRCVQQLCREHGVRRVRIRQTFGAALRIDNRLYNWWLRQHFACAEGFGSYGAYRRTTRVFPASAVVELMLHPGRDDYAGEMQAFARDIDQDFWQHHEVISHRELN